MVAQITLRNNEAITAPAGWTAIGNLRTSGTGLEQALYYRIATAADTPASTYTWSWLTNADASAAIVAYSGFDATSPFDITPTDNAGSSTSAIASGLTATQANDMLIAFYGAQGNATAVQDAAQTMTQEYTVQSGSRPDARSRHPTSPWRPGEPGPVEAGKAPHRRRLAQLTARPPEWFVPARLGVCGASGDEEEVGEPVEVGEHERVDPVLLVRDERITLGSAARRARDVQTRGCLDAARQDEALQHGQIGVELVAPLLEPIDRTLFDTQPVGDAEGNTEVGAHVEKVVLNELE